MLNKNSNISDISIADVC